MKEQWIIGVCNTDCDGVDLFTFCGTEEEMKEKLVEMVRYDKENDDSYDFGTESSDEIRTVCKGGDLELYAYGNYCNYHIDYTAKRLKDILCCYCY